MTPETHILILCDDLIFSSRITGTAKSLGFHARVFSRPTDLINFSMQSPPRCVIIDLNFTALVIEDLTRDLTLVDSRPLLVGYGSHVDAATLKRARDAGVNIVWPRSKFVEELGAALPGWCGAAEPD